MKTPYLRLYNPLILAAICLSYSGFGLSANWLNVGRVYLSNGGYVELTNRYDATQIETNSGATQTNQAFDSQVSTNYQVNAKHQMRGYVSKPWIAQFAISSSLDNTLYNFHEIDQFSGVTEGSIVARITPYPYAAVQSQITLGISPTWSFNADQPVDYSQSQFLDIAESYNANQHNGNYTAHYRQDDNHQNLSLTGKQLFEQNSLSQSLGVTDSYASDNSNRSRTVSLYAKHSLQPEYSGVIVNNVVSAVDTSPADGSYSGPLPVVINSNFSYMYDTEYVDTNTVPSIGGGISLVLDRAEILPPQISANANVGWPMWRQLKMSTQLGYSAYGDSTSTTLSQQVRRQFKSKVVGQIKYDRYLQGTAKNIWANDYNQLSWEMGGGHAIRYPQVYELLQPISVGITQDFNLVGNTNETLQGGNLTHSAVLSTTRNDITISSSLSDTRAYQFALNASTAVQSAQLSLAKPIISSAYVSSNAKFNLQWQHRQIANEDVTTQSANLQYQYNSRRIANVRNLSGNYSVTGKLDDSGSELSGNGAINYRIGSVQIAGKSSITLLSSKRFSAELNIKRFF